jgi:hypothetical protein
MDNSSGKVSANLQGGRWKKLDVERFSQVTLTPVLMIGADCSLFTSKPAHFSPYLPTGQEKIP